MLDVPENELFSAYLDGELSAEEQAEMENMLKTNPAARQLMDEFRALGAALQSLPVAELKEDLGGRVLRAAERQMLSEPTAADRTKDRAGRDMPTRARLLKRLLRGRTLWWSGVAVAVALWLTFGDPADHDGQPGGNDNRVAINTPSSADPVTGPQEIKAVEDADPPTVVAADPTGNPAAIALPKPESLTTPDPRPEVAKPGDGPLIVKCDVTEEAARGQVFSEILSKRKIARLDRTDTETGRVFVEVDLTPTQLRTLVADLASRRRHFVAVSVPLTPGAAGPRIPSAAGPSCKVGAIGGGAPASSDNLRPAGKRSPTGSSAGTDTKAAVSKSGQQTDKDIGKPADVRRSGREERKFRVRFELKVVDSAASRTVGGNSPAQSEKAPVAAKNEE